MDTAEPTLSIEQKLCGLIIVCAEAKYAFPAFDKLLDLDWDRSLQQLIPRENLLGSMCQRVRQWAAGRWAPNTRGLLKGSVILRRSSRQ